MKNSKGITLIALVITIIVMLILVAVTISMAVNGGLFNYAGDAAKGTNDALKADQQLANGGVNISGEWFNSIDEYLDKDKVEYISEDKSYVGYYADVDGNGTVDGVIYADLAKGNTGDGQWVDDNGSYTIPTETGLKKYCKSEIDDGIEVITVAQDGKDRFYVMALENIGDSSNTWYESKWAGMTVITSEDFGTGKANTETMIEMWNEDTDEAKNSDDVWGQIQTQVNNGWFLPSRGEWAAFAEELEITDDNYSDFVPAGYYLSSSLNPTGVEAYCACFGSYFGCDIGWSDISNPDGNSIRLSTTF